MRNSLKLSTARLLSLPEPLKLFLLASVVLTLISFAFTIACRYAGLGLPYSFPYVYLPNEMFGDLIGLQPKFDLWGTPAFFTDKGGYFMYPSPLVHVYRLLLTASVHVMRRYVVLAGASILILCAILLKALRKNGLSAGQAALFVFSTVILSYPLAVLLLRWNIEVLVWLLTSLGIWQFVSDRPKTSAVFVGLAASLKLYPLILLGLFLPRRRYAAFFLSIFVFLGVSLISLYAIGPSIGAAYAWNSFQLQQFTKYYAGSLWALGYDHSFFGLVKVFTLAWHPNVDHWVRPYTITAGLASLILYFARIWRIPLVNQVIALSVLNVMLAPVSFDYTLLNLYPALVLLAIVVLRAEQGLAPEVPYANVYMLLFALVLTPQSYIIVHGTRYVAQFRAVCLIAVLVLALTRPIYASPAPDSDLETEEKDAGFTTFTAPESSAALR
jgi:hypothetical protein